MKNILLIQFRTGESELHEKSCFNRVEKSDGGFHITPINSLDDSVNWNNPEELLNGYDGVVLGGSGEFNFTGHTLTEKQTQFEKALSNAAPLTKYLIKHDIPTLGICFGHQMLGHFLDTPTVLDEKQAKSGSHEVKLLDAGKNDPVFIDIPENFYAQYGHKGVLSKMPENSTLLATGERCDNTAFKHKENIYGVQFHPELDKDDIVKKMTLHPEYMKGATIQEFMKTVKSSSDATRIIENFANKSKR